MIIGKFTKDGNGYVGELTTLTHRQALKFEPLAEKKVDYIVTADGVEVGAGWKKTSQRSGSAYVSVKLDSPFLLAPVYAALIHQDDGGYILIWSRDDRKDD